VALLLPAITERMRIPIAFVLLAAAVTASAFAEAPTRPLVYLDQGWSQTVRERFYYTPQGSHMMPADWFRVLERPDGQGRFGDSAYLKVFGFLAPDVASSDLNPEGYPIGFAVEPEANQVGLTCAACHTADVEMNGEVIRIDGAPALLDFDSFYQALSKAVSLTLLDPRRFESFAAALGATGDMAAAELRAQLAAYNVKLTGDAVLRTPALLSGFGRVDALTQILNSLAVRDQSLPANMYPVVAPTSYPALWLTPELEFVQWNPIAASPIARNGGQVLGVFGRTDMTTGAGADAFRSTILIPQLRDLDQWLQMLAPPKWDEVRMGSIEAKLASMGEALFRDACAGCHNMAPYERTDPADNHFGKTFIKIGRVNYRKIGTDTIYAQNLVTRQIATNTTTAPLFKNAPIVPAPAFFNATVGASIRRAMDDEGLTLEQKLALNGFRFRTGPDGQPVPYEPPRLSDLKASPLAAVWATGPYLHNGSVPTIYELLSPVEERRAVFWTGGRSLDLERLGYQSGDAPGRFRFDTRLPGNGNGGHLYPSDGLTHDERMAIIEYLKTQ
jgi:mono/diheme cytochrome c family protein